jgi:Esterase-like activity of phytase
LFFPIARRSVDWLTVFIAQATAVTGRRSGSWPLSGRAPAGKPKLSRPAGGCFALGLAVLAGCQASSGAEPPQAVRASAFAFEPDPGQPPDFGSLEFRAGFVLASGDPRFGGLSGLWIAPGGERLIAASDSGTLWLAEPDHADDGALIGFAGWRAVEPGTMPGDPTERDAEALAATAGDLVVAYEGAHRLRRVPLDFPASPAAPLPTPPGLEEAHNRGIEALVALPDGALLAIAEGVRTPGGDLAAWLIAEDRTAPLAYAPAPRLCADRHGSPGRHHLRPRATIFPARRSRRARRCAGYGRRQTRGPSRRP